MGERLKSLREQLHLSQAQVASGLSLKSPAAISMWETGKRKPRVDMLPKIAAFFGCSISDLYGN